jgi:tRNA threonylcarbamoyl adenosine modification protein YeaZ
MLAEIIGKWRPSSIAVGVGPGSFTGIRVALAASHGLAIGWGAEISGFSSIALVAAAAPSSDPTIAAALVGGHGQLFVQQFDGLTLEPLDQVQSLTPTDAASAISAGCIIGSGAASLFDARGTGTIVEGIPSVAHLFRLPVSLRRLDPKPVYVRAPDAKAKVFA